MLLLTNVIRPVRPALLSGCAQDSERRRDRAEHESSEKTGGDATHAWLSLDRGGLVTNVTNPGSGRKLRHSASMSGQPLQRLQRPAAGAPEGLLILHHGRGSDERDLLGLADVIDPDARLHVVTPRGPLTLPGWPGFHWYVVPRVGFPDHDTFHAGYDALAALHDGLWEATGVPPSRTVLGGFSMGSVMSYALALGAGRPPVAGIMAFSGFVPTVDGWAPDLGGREATRVFIAHGRADPVMDVAFARCARELLAGAGLDVDYRESDVAHQIDPGHLPGATGWLATTISEAAP